MTYDAINIPLTILSLNKEVKDTFRAPEASASASAVQDKSLGTRISELYDAIGIIYYKNTLHLWNTFANKIKKDVAIFIGDNVSFKDNKAWKFLTKPINILIACSKANDTTELNKELTPKQFYAFKHYIHIYGNGVFQCPPNVRGPGSLESTPEDFFEFVGDKEINIQLLIQYFYKSRKAIERGCGYVPIEAIMDHIEKNHLLPLPGNDDKAPKLSGTISGRKNCKLSKDPNDCYDEEFENYFSRIIIEEEEKERTRDALIKEQIKARLKKAEEEEVAEDDEPYEYSEGGRKRKTRKEKNRANCIRLYTRSNNVLKKRWTKNHCRKTSKRLICKISKPSELPCDDDKKLSYYNFARWPIRSFRNSRK